LLKRNSPARPLPCDTSAVSGRVPKFPGAWKSLLAPTETPWKAFEEIVLAPTRFMVDMFILMPWPPFEEIVFPWTTASAPSKTPIPSPPLPEIVFAEAAVAASMKPIRALAFSLTWIPRPVLLWMLLPWIVAEDAEPTKTPRPLLLIVLP